MTTEREAFEAARAAYVRLALNQAIERRGGINALLNPFFYTESDYPPTGTVANDLPSRKRSLDRLLSSDSIELTIKKVELNGALQPQCVRAG